MNSLSKGQKHLLWRIIASAVVFALYYIIDAISGGLGVPLSFVIVTVSYVTSGYDVIYSAVRNIIRGKLLDEKFLMLIATVGAYALGDFGEAAAVMLFYQTGEFFQSYAVGKSRRSIKELMDICPEYASVERGGELCVVMPDEVEVGEIIVVKPGEKIPLDGIVTSGTSWLDTSSLTGESLRREAKEGSEVYSGSINLSGVIKVKVTKDFDNSTVSRILELVENSAFNKSKSEAFITRFAKVYTPFVVICALLVAFVPPLIVGSFPAWLRRALIFLVISCPCALVISVPLSFFASIGCASKHGILIKGSNWLEALGRAETIVFDKTGTLTKGNFVITRICPSDSSDDDRLMSAAAHCEYYSDHPIAEVIKSAYPHINAGDIEGFEAISGCGVLACVQGKTIRCGKASHISQYCDAVVSSNGVHVCEDGEYLGCIEIDDEIKSESASLIATLHQKGINTVMLTGDSHQAADWVAKELGLGSVHAELMPQDKTAVLSTLIAERSSKNAVVFVGDGINDAPALSLADVGIAMGSLGSDAAIEAADIVIMDDDISKINTALSICRKTNSIVRQNIAFSLGVKLLVMVLGTLGFANMWAAVFADVGVAFIAILNSFRAFKL